MNFQSELEKALDGLGLLEKAREIYLEMGDRAVLSYIKSSYRLLSKVYHPDLNPEKMDKARIIQQRLNKTRQITNLMQDREIIEMIKSGTGRRLKPKKKVLIVDDESGLQELYGNVLIMEGYNVKTADDGAVAFEIYEQFQPDLIFTDIVMPIMNGIELVKKIRKIDSKIKTVFMSGFLEFQNLKKELDAMVEKYGYQVLSKPFKVSEMLACISSYIDDAEKGGTVSSSDRFVQGF